MINILVYFPSNVLFKLHMTKFANYSSSRIAVTK